MSNKIAELIDVKTKDVIKSTVKNGKVEVKSDSSEIWHFSKKSVPIKDLRLDELTIVLKHCRNQIYQAKQKIDTLKGKQELALKVYEEKSGKSINLDLPKEEFFEQFNK